MKVCVLGAGVIGLTTAWALSEAGCEVAVVDRDTVPGRGASAANGAQLSYSYVAPLASPDTLRHLPALLLDRDGPLRVRPGLDPDFLRWAVAFLRACRTGVARETTAAQLALAALSRAELDRVAGAAGVEFGRRVAGKLVLFRRAASFAAARRQAQAQAGSGAEQRALGAAECLALEPGLRLTAAEVAGGVFTPSEEVGDCAAFCRGLAERLRGRASVSWHMGEEAAPVLRGGAVRAVRVGAREVAADRFVLCLGAGSARFARRAGVRLPVYPMKGYSLTLRPRTPGGALAHSVTDADRKVVFAPLAEDGAPLIRAAGIADLVGHDPALDPARLAAVRDAAFAALDVDRGADSRLDLRPWAGLRPATPDSRPIVGPSPVPGLFLNTGHGALGWTLACGSARLATDLLLGRQPPIRPGWFGLERTG